MLGRLSQEKKESDMLKKYFAGRKKSIESGSIKT